MISAFCSLGFGLTLTSSAIPIWRVGQISGVTSQSPLGQAVVLEKRFQYTKQLSSSFSNTRSRLFRHRVPAEQLASFCFCKREDIIVSEDHETVAATESPDPKMPSIPGVPASESVFPESKYKSSTAVMVDEISIETVMQELRAIQATGPKLIAMLGTRHLSIPHQQIVEMLSYALVLTGNHIFTSGAGGTNAAVIRGALRAEKEDLLTVILPQSLDKQPPESQEQLKKVVQMFETSKNDNLSLQEASALCNEDIISRTNQVICFAFHDSHVLISACQKAKEQRKLTTVLYLD
mmetsp:Transcript_11387/g.19882  ORF Transcript_11387/g.19882 Transcript_11387/m.19882 type:complete len:293 (+) Transcript_11387:54-932(+)